MKNWKKNSVHESKKQHNSMFDIEDAIKSNAEALTNCRGDTTETSKLDVTVCNDFFMPVVHDIGRLTKTHDSKIPAAGSILSLFGSQSSECNENITRNDNDTDTNSFVEDAVDDENERKTMTLVPLNLAMTPGIAPPKLALPIEFPSGTLQTMSFQEKLISPLRFKPQYSLPVKAFGNRGKTATPAKLDKSDPKNLTVVKYNHNTVDQVNQITDYRDSSSQFKDNASSSVKSIAISTNNSYEYDGVLPPIATLSTSGEHTDDVALKSQVEPEVLQQPLTEQETKTKSTMPCDLDPFAPRIAKALSFRNVNLTLLQHGINVTERKILENIYGEVPHKKVATIIGGVKSGNTSLLKILAGRPPWLGRFVVEADIRLDNIVVDPCDSNFHKSIAFIRNDDSLKETMTPKEAFIFAAKLRLPRSTTTTEIGKLASRIVCELGLNSCACTPLMGTPLSVKLRTSIGIELVAKPSYFLLEEPLTGLDSFAMAHICALLKKIAQTGISVLFTMHQPTSAFFHFHSEHLIALQKGRLLFQGPAESLSGFLEVKKMPCPIQFSPGEWILHIASMYPIKSLKKVGFYQENDKENISPDASQEESTTVERKSNARGFAMQSWMLILREAVSAYRRPYPILIRLGFTLILSVFVGLLYFQIGWKSPVESQLEQSIFGGLIVLLMVVMFHGAISTLTNYMDEYPISLREITHYYSTIAYFTARLCIEAFNTAIHIAIMTTIIYFLVGFRGSYIKYLTITFVFAMTSSALAALIGSISGKRVALSWVLMAALFLPQLLFSGYFISLEFIPPFLRWAQWLCIFAYASRVLMVEEFSDCSRDPEPETNCDDFLDTTNTTMGELSWVTLIYFYVVFRVGAMLVLRVQVMNV